MVGGWGLGAGIGFGVMLKLGRLCGVWENRFVVIVVVVAFVCFKHPVFER